MSTTSKHTPQLLPRLIRLRDAPFYLGMDRNRFNAEVRPTMQEIPIGEQGIAFDRLDLDGWVDQYKRRNGRPTQPTGGTTWDAQQPQGLGIAMESGTSKSRFSEKRFMKALEQAASKKRN